MESDPESMRAVAARVSDLADEFWRDVEELLREADAVMSADWTGDAASSHYVCWQEWVESARTLTAALSDDATLIRQAANRYDRTDTVVDASLHHLRLGD